MFSCFTKLVQHGETIQWEEYTTVDFRSLRIVLIKLGLKGHKLLLQIM